ncbi:MAG: LysR family transcriptional regulator [Eubacterium sp.]|nr:LysR family transcriptional regulator [Eubacterium sp.]
MTLLSYQVFQAVVNQGSFQKAAQVLSLTPSAVSHAVSSMEQELGNALFVRSKKGITLTSYGEYLLPYINAVLTSEEHLHQAINGINELQQGTVKVGCFSSVCTNWIPDIIHSFQADYPGIQIEIYEGTYADVSYWIKNGIVEIGFLSSSSAGDLPFEPLYEDPLLCVVPSDYQKKLDSPVMTIEEMQNESFVSQRETTDADITNFFKSNGLNVHSAYHVVDDLSTISMVAEGFGICIMPALVMNDIPYAVKTYPVSPKASRIIGISALEPELLAPAAKILYQHILHLFIIS